MDVLCTDKTGTLTEARIRLVRHIATVGPRQRPGARSGLAQQPLREPVIRSPLDDAILARTIDRRLDKLDEVPFDFERRRVSVLVERDGGRMLIVKGAPEDISALSTRYERAGRAAPRSSTTRRGPRATRASTSSARRDFAPSALPRREWGPSARSATMADETRAHLRWLRRVPRPAEGECRGRRRRAWRRTASPSRSSPATTSTSPARLRANSAFPSTAC